MNKFSFVFVLYLFTLTITGSEEVNSRLQASNRVEPTNKHKDQSKKTVQYPQHVSAHAAVGGGMIGVASIAGVDSRNGRFSSIKFFPPIDPSTIKTDKKENYFFKSTNGNMPLKITNQGDGVSSSIEIQPGSVSVSAKSGPEGSASAISSAGFDPWPIPYSSPLINDIFFQPTFPPFPNIPDPFVNSNTNLYFPKIQPLKFPWIQDPWSQKSVYKPTYNRRDVFRPNWYFPSFDPFVNFW